MSYHVVETQSFWDSVNALRKDALKNKAALLDTMSELRLRPFQNNKLNTHGVGEAKNGHKIYASDVGGRRSDRRVVWQLFNRTIVLLLFGNHKVYDRVKGISIRFDPQVHTLTVIEQNPESGEDRPYHLGRRPDGAGQLLMAWSDKELREFGFPDHLVTHLRRLNHDDELLAMEDLLGETHFERCYNLIAYGHPDGEKAAAEAARVRELEVNPTPPPAIAEDLDFERQLQDENMPAWFTRTEPAFLEEIMGRPIEDWMIFLHPDQRTAVRRSYQGPALVRGSAGTGKTVVGLHRAAWLAQRNRTQRQETQNRLIRTEEDKTRPVLFTTFVKNLPPVFKSLYLRLPSALSGEVEFNHVDSLAHRICREAQDWPSPNQKKVEEAFSVAYQQVVVPGSRLKRSGFTKRYIREEITAVIKGRAIEVLDEYLQIARTGRRVPMDQNIRTEMWRLREAWDKEMSERGVMDFPDIRLRALRHARRLKQPLYSSIIVDEAQDITMAGLLFLRALVNAPHPEQDRPDGLLILGDGAQRIYPGGFTLRQAGLEVRGRTTVLNINYRNTGEIIEAAMAMAGDTPVQGLAEDYLRAEAKADPVRRGPSPLMVDAGNTEAQLDELVRRIEDLTKQDSNIGPGDVGVLAPNKKLVNKIIARIKAARLGVQSLDDYDGRGNSLIKVGTFHRGKGLEFKAVFLPGLTKNQFPMPPSKHKTVEEANEEHLLQISQLFVAMTRARDVLVILYNHQPSQALVWVTGHFNHQESIATQPNATMR